MAMIAAFEFHDHLAVCCAAGQPNARHRCFRAAVYHPDFFDRRHPGADQFRELDFEWVRNSEAQSARRGVAHRFFEEQGIATPPTWLPDEAGDDLRFPVLVKARRGFGSRHIYRANDAGELAFFLAHTSADSMIQTVCGGEEFSIDVFCDLDRRCLNAVPRTMIESKVMP